MGIPSYFSYIIKNYPNIIRKLPECEKFDYLFMDSNSIVYDSYYELEQKYMKTPFDITDIENMIIKKVIEKIDDLIRVITPTQLTYIAFDGIPPLAKIEQQKKRRYKSAFLAKALKTEKIWDTCSITPGTDFMILLDTEITNYYKRFSNIITSCSNEKGEGEHKIFRYIRDNDLSNQNVVIYGLDSDLIMLSILHSEQVKNIKVMREAPSFVSVLASSVKIETSEKMLLDIIQLSNGIETEMEKGIPNDEEKEVKKRKKDYIMMSILLGNDFVPNIGSIYIREDGMERLMKAYKEVKENLIDEKKEIKWKNVKKYLLELEKEERERIKEKIEKKVRIEKKLENVPMLYREEEKSIGIESEGWEKRYRRITESNGKSYKEMLYWIWDYYSGIEREEISYNGKNGPLIQDILLEIGEPSKKKTQEYSLEYVIPKNNKVKMKQEIQEKIKNKKEENMEFIWMFKKYFWESELL